MTVANRLDDLVVALTGAREAVASGAEIDLAGLESAVETAMAEARQAPPADHSRLLASLKALVTELERLAVALARQHHADAQRRATAAYGAAPPPGAEGDER